MIAQLLNARRKEGTFIYLGVEVMCLFPVGGASVLLFSNLLAF